MSKSNPIGVALQGVELFATQGRMGAVTGAFANAAVAYAPLVPFADAAHFMAGLNRGKAPFVAGVQSLCRSDALRGTIANASPSEQKTILRALAHPSFVTVGMTEASHALLGGIAFVGEGMWPVATLHTILNGVIQAGGFGALVVRFEARIHPFSPEDEAAALAELHRIERGFQWPVPAADIRRMVKAGVRGDDQPVSLAKSAWDLSNHETDFFCFSFVAQALLASGVLPLSAARQDCLFLTDFLLNRSTRIESGSGETGCCYPWSILLGDLAASYLGIGVYLYREHVQVVHRKTGVVCDINGSGEKLRLQGDQALRQGRCLPPNPSPYPLRALIAATCNNLSMSIRSAVPADVDDDAFDRARMEQMRLVLLQARICPTDGSHRTVAHGLLVAEEEGFERAMWHLDRAEALHPDHPLTAAVRGEWYMVMERTEEGEAAFARARRLAAAQCQAVEASGCGLPPFMQPEGIDEWRADALLMAQRRRGNYGE